MFVLVDRANGGDPSHYKVALVGIDGRLLKVLTPDEPTVNLSGQNSAPSLISISNTRVYYLDGDTSVAYYSRDGSAGLATNLPGGPSKLVSFAVSPDDARIAFAIFDYSAGGPAVTISVQDLVGGGHKTALYSSASSAEWPVAWNQGHVILAVGSSLAPLPPDTSPFAIPNPYNATGGYRGVDATTGEVVDTIPPECAYGLLVAGGTPCSQTGGGVGLRTWSGSTSWYANSREASFALREALAPNGQTVAANSSPGSIGLFDSGTKIDVIAGIAGPAVAMGWIDSTHLVVRRFYNSPPTATIVDTKDGKTIDIVLSCGASTALVACTDPVMFGTL
jgi:hypothetical protein